jgi:hypothetical protein
MTVKELLTLDDALLTETYELYREIFDPLAELAFQCHVLEPDDYRAVADDKKIRKLLRYNDEGELVGLATMTNQLESVKKITPISLPYFRRNWPVHYDRQALWYVGYVGVRQTGNTAGSFEELLMALWDLMVSNNGISFQDYCSFNEDVTEINRITKLIFRRAGISCRTERMDSQTLYMLEKAA